MGNYTRAFTSSVGNEEVYTIMLIPIESNLLKVFRKYPESNSRQLKEFICLVLKRIKGYLVGKQPDVAKFETSENT